MLGISALLAIRHAVASCGPEGAMVDLNAPATPEAVLRAIAAVRAERPAASPLPAELPL